MGGDSKGTAQLKLSCAVWFLVLVLSLPEAFLRTGGFSLPWPFCPLLSGGGWSQGLGWCWRVCEAGGEAQLLRRGEGLAGLIVAGQDAEVVGAVHPHLDGVVVALLDVVEVAGPVGGHPDGAVLVTDGGVGGHDVGDAVAAGGDDAGSRVAATSTAAAAGGRGEFGVLEGVERVAVVLRHLVGHLDLVADEVGAARAEVHAVEGVLLAQGGAGVDGGLTGLRDERDDVLGVATELRHEGTEAVDVGLRGGVPGVEPEERVVGVAGVGLVADD